MQLRHGVNGGFMKVMGLGCRASCQPKFMSRTRFKGPRRKSASQSCSFDQQGPFSKPEAHCRPLLPGHHPPSGFAQFLQQHTSVMLQINSMMQKRMSSLSLVSPPEKKPSTDNSPHHPRKPSGDPPTTPADDLSPRRYTTPPHAPLTSRNQPRASRSFTATNVHRLPHTRCGPPSSRCGLCPDRSAVGLDAVRRDA